jgi:transposase-like protein
MPEHRRKFSPQFKAEAVQMVIPTCKPIAEVAPDLGIHEGTLGIKSVSRPAAPPSSSRSRSRAITDGLPFALACSFTLASNTST